MIERSQEVPVIVDFWAEWCGPCRTLGPALEAAVDKRAGEAELVKVDTDRNPNLAMSFQIRGIPAVKAFRDGKVVAEFTGAIPPPQIEQFLDRLVPSPADKLAAEGDEDSLRKALRARPRQRRRDQAGTSAAGARPGCRGAPAPRGQKRRLRGRGPGRPGAADHRARRRARRRGGSVVAELLGLGRRRLRGGPRRPSGGPRRDRRSRSARPGAQRHGGDLHRARRRPSAGSGAPSPSRRGTPLTRGRTPLN